MQCLKASTILNGQKVKQIKTDVKSESKREWKSCTELGRSSQSHTYLIPLLSNGSNVPSPGPYTTIGTNLSVTSTLQDAGNHTVTKTPNRSSVNGSSCVDPQVGNAVVSCGSRDKKTGSDSGDQGSLDGTQKSMKKHARRLTGHGDPYNSVQGSPGGSGSYNVVTGSKCLLHDATTKR
uniref:Uncharacterized protein TCIL3000_11_16720 n=1 Tax=Trypanosoma congolense (strain IL3000) TaxID=1068625 RepID=G0V3D5_TRYCI|nr:unnamed protein product [Trypanosoma congolense IL3000]